ncbi:hypothetical protein KKH56_01115 [bacterium]|nr:hypothetical protein [bacterium]
MKICAICGFSLLLTGCFQNKTIVIKEAKKPKIDISSLKRVGLVVLHPEEVNEDLGQRMGEILRADLSKDCPFYILEEYELRTLTEGVKFDSSLIEHPGKVGELLEKISAQGLFVFDIEDFTEEEIKDFEIKTYYSPEEKEYISSKVYYLERYYRMPSSIYLFTKDKSPLWQKDSPRLSAYKKYLDHPGISSQGYDQSLLEKLIDPVSTDFKEVILEKYEIHKRKLILIKD